MNVMLDIETLGTRDNTAILSIGGAAFNTETVEDSFYATISIADNFRHDRSVDADALEWWLKQPDESIQPLFDSDTRVEFQQALRLLSVYITKHVRRRTDTVWANGVMFDLNILRNAFNMIGLRVPWHYRQECCMRSLRRLEPFPGVISWSDLCLQFRTTEQWYTPHHAGADAMAQAKYVQQWQKLAGDKS